MPFAVSAPKCKVGAVEERGRQTGSKVLQESEDTIVQAIYEEAGEMQSNIHVIIFVLLLVAPGAGFAALGHPQPTKTRGHKVTSVSMKSSSTNVEVTESLERRQGTNDGLLIILLVSILAVLLAIACAAFLLTVFVTESPSQPSYGTN